jgi:hypothetical protein
MKPTRKPAARRTAGVTFKFKLRLPVLQVPGPPSPSQARARVTAATWQGNPITGLRDEQPRAGPWPPPGPRRAVASPNLNYSESEIRAHGAGGAGGLESQVNSGSPNLNSSLEIGEIARDHRVARATRIARDTRRRVGRALRASRAGGGGEESEQPRLRRRRRRWRRRGPGGGGRGGILAAHLPEDRLV